MKQCGTTTESNMSCELQLTRAILKKLFWRAPLKKFVHTLLVLTIMTVVSLKKMLYQLQVISLF